MCMETYINKTTEKFRLNEFEAKYNKRALITTKYPVPMVNETDAILLDEEGKICHGVNYRELVGSPMWASTVCRPDIKRPTNLMAKWSCKAHTLHRVKALCKILSYLDATIQNGVG